MPEATSDVGRYYDRNTRRFLALGHGGGELAIRRAVWGPGVRSRGEAMQYVNALLLDELRCVSAAEVVDLGCGVGGSIAYLRQRHAARYVGATISATQARLGAGFLEQDGCSDARIVHADFTTTEFASALARPADVAFGIESFIHVDGIREKLRGIAELIRPGGTLVICDDMLSRSCEHQEPRPVQRRWLGEFRTGWYARGLTSITGMIEAAHESGLVLLEVRDLTPYLELDRTRDLLARAFMAIVRRSPVRPAWFSNLLGGNALQLCLKNGIIRYVYAVFRRKD